MEHISTILQLIKTRIIEKIAHNSNENKKDDTTII